MPTPTAKNREGAASEYQKFEQADMNIPQINFPQMRQVGFGSTWIPERYRGHGSPTPNQDRPPTIKDRPRVTGATKPLKST